MLNLDGILFRFIDTAGIRDAQDEVEKIGIQRTFQKLEQAEIVLGMLDCTEDEYLLQDHLPRILEKVDPLDQKLFILLNKVDKVPQEAVNKIVTIINIFVLSRKYQADIIQLAAKKGDGVPALKEALKKAESSLISNADSTFITNARHYEALIQAAAALRNLSAALQLSIPTDLLAEDLRAALASINSILGKDLGVDAQTVLNRIFQSHCIGK